MAQTGGEVPLAPHSGQSQPRGWGAHRGRHTGPQTAGGSVLDAPVHRLCPRLCQVQRQAAQALWRSSGSEGCPGPAPMPGPPTRGGGVAELTVPRVQAGMARTPSVSGWASHRPQVHSDRIWVRECGGTRALGRFPTPGAPSVSPGRQVPGPPSEQRPRRHTAPPAAPGYSTGHYAPLGPPEPQWEHRRPLPQHLPPRSAPSPPSGPPGRPCPSAVPRSPGGTPFPGLPGTPGAAGAGSSQTGEGRGRENRRRRARGKAGGGAARGEIGRAHV